MAGPDPRLLSTGGAANGTPPFVGVRVSGVGMIPAFLSEAIRSDPTAVSEFELVDAAAADTENDLSWAREA